MKTTKETYKKMAEKAAPPSPKAKDFLFAFLIGGAICALGQIFREIFLALQFSEETTKMLVCIALIFLAALLTFLRIFEKIARHAGAGTLVPITGFANAIVSNAMEFRSEGLIFGTGVKMFNIAGPVIVYGTIASVIYGIIYWICQMI